MDSQKTWINSLVFTVDLTEMKLRHTLTILALLQNPSPIFSTLCFNTHIKLRKYTNNEKITKKSGTSLRGTNIWTKFGAIKNYEKNMEKRVCDKKEKRLLCVLMCTCASRKTCSVRCNPLFACVSLSLPRSIHPRHLSSHNLTVWP